jgi:hypothetical protein
LTRTLPRDFCHTPDLTIARQLATILALGGNG